MATSTSADMDRRDDHRSRNPRTRSDRSRSPPTGDRSNTSDRRRERSPLRASHRQPARSNGPPPASSRARDSTTGPPSHRPGSRRPDLPNQPRGAPAQRQSTQNPKAANTVMALLEGEDEEAQMSRIMGFAGFRSTKNTKVPGNDKNYGVSKVKKTEYRQYMNRVGGFNRPLDAA